MKQALLAAFGNPIAVCINETNSAQIEIFDCYNCSPIQRRSYIKTAVNEPVHFTLHNPSQEKT